MANFDRQFELYCQGTESVGPIFRREIVGVEPIKVTVGLDNLKKLEPIDCPFFRKTKWGDICLRPESDPSVPVDSERSSFRVLCIFYMRNNRIRWQRNEIPVSEIENLPSLD